MPQTPRPIYVIGHNTNTIDEIRDGLQHGVNAFEPDINVDAHDKLYVSHGRVSSPTSAMPVKPFLQQLRVEFEKSAGRAALLMLDCKVENPQLAVQLRDLVRSELTSHVKVSVIFNVATLTAAERFFAEIRTGLQPNEALMIDEEDHPGDVAHFFDANAVPRGCYGNGISTVPVLGIGLPSPNLESQMDTAVALRAMGSFAWTYSWVLVRESTIVEHLRLGVDGVMIDLSNAGVMKRVLEHRDLRGRVRLATAQDDPFRPVDWPVVTVFTSDVGAAGTDSAITFTMQQGQVSLMERTVDASYAGRFERRGTNAVTFAGHDTPPPGPMTITIRSDRSGWGPDWHLHEVTLRSRSTAPRRATFDEWFDDSRPRSRTI